VLLLALTTTPRAGDEAGDLIRRGKRALDAGRVADAEANFARAAEVGSGDDRMEALYLRASVTHSGTEAESTYRALIDADAKNEYARRAVLELAKIQFATGRYEGAYATLHDNDACAESEEACLFEGMSAVMLRHYDSALSALERVRHGRAKTWATLLTAEALDGSGQSDAACAQYAALARARVSPTGWYRHAECLEKAGDLDGARKEYAAVAEVFPLTPEAIRAGDKSAPAVPAVPVTPPARTPDVDENATPRGVGYTIQFASFGDRVNAIKMSSRIKEQYPAVRIDSELINNHEVFRVRYGFYATREAARAAGESMSKQLDEQFTIMPVAASNDR